MLWKQIYTLNKIIVQPFKAPWFSNLSLLQVRDSWRRSLQTALFTGDPLPGLPGHPKPTTQRWANSDSPGDSGPQSCCGFFGNLVCHIFCLSYKCPMFSVQICYCCHCWKEAHHPFPSYSIHRHSKIKWGSSSRSQRCEFCSHGGATWWGVCGTSGTPSGHQLPGTG